MGRSASTSPISLQIFRINMLIIINKVNKSRSSVNYKLNVEHYNISLWLGILPVVKSIWYKRVLKHCTCSYCGLRSFLGRQKYSHNSILSGLFINMHDTFCSCTLDLNF